MANFVQNLLSNAGYALRLPGLGVSEPVGTAYAAGRTPQAVASGQVPQNFSSPIPTSSIGNNSFTQSPSGSASGAAPSSGGQAAAPQGGSNGGNNQPSQPSQPQNNQPSADDQYISSLRNAYSESANALQGQVPQLDSAYNTATGTINDQIKQAQTAADQQKTQNTQNFGDVLRQNAQTYNELQNRQRGTYSALGTLDSSAYQDDQQKAAQGLADNQSRTANQQNVQSNTIDNSLTSFRSQAMSKLADLGTQYQQGKSQIAQSLANNDLSRANAIQNALGGIRQQAQQTQNSILNFGLQAGVLAGYGKNATDAISGATGSSFVQNLLGSLQNVQNQTASKYVVPTAGLQGAGYIGSNNKSQINPFTGQPIQQATQ